MRHELVRIGTVGRVSGGLASHAAARKGWDLRVLAGSVWCEAGLHADQRNAMDQQRWLASYAAAHEGWDL